MHPIQREACGTYSPIRGITTLQSRCLRTPAIHWEKCPPETGWLPESSRHCALGCSCGCKQLNEFRYPISRRGRDHSSSHVASASRLDFSTLEVPACRIATMNTQTSAYWKIGGKPSRTVAGCCRWAAYWHLTGKRSSASRRALDRDYVGAFA